MNLELRSPTELETLLEALCEDRLAPADAARLERIVLSSPEARWRYLTYMDLHGTLFWDAAGAGSPEPLSSHELPVRVRPSHEKVETNGSSIRDLPAVAAGVAAFRQPATRHSARPHALTLTSISACVALVALVAWNVSGPSKPSEIVVREGQPLSVANANDATGIEGTTGDAGANGVAGTKGVLRTYGPPIVIADAVAVETEAAETDSLRTIAGGQLPTVIPVSSHEVVARIDSEIRSRWEELGLQPSAKADDAEWLRRISLDLLGRVPAVAEAESFLADTSGVKRETLIERLLDDPEYVRNFTTKWTNLLLGRSSNPLVNRDAFRKFLRLSFAANRPWNRLVADLVSAEGNNSDNGATNFLIAHLNNDAAPATAVASRLFLARQVHCNQCHNNPFDETKQIAFWELNSFFQQTTCVPRQRRDPGTGRVLQTFTELVTRDAGGPTYFETQTGLMRVAYPRFGGREIDPSPETNRRHELARLMTDGEQPQLAAAFVNRMWEHFLGCGFTRDVNDLGPHQPASHPELLAVLSEQFIRSGYDIKQLIRWICQSEPYQLTSRFAESNQNDDPSLGELPAFSRMYVKSMTAEQTYDSLLTATKAHRVGAADWTQAEQNRQQWLQQFVVASNNDDNDETMAFDGSIGNALSLMNGPLIERALDTSAGSFLGEVIRQKSTEAEKIRSLCLATLSRPPSPTEFSTMKKLVRDGSSNRGSKGQPVEAYQDLFWALLNSNEFASIH